MIKLFINMNCFYEQSCSSKKIAFAAVRKS